MADAAGDLAPLVGAQVRVEAVRAQVKPASHSAAPVAQAKAPLKLAAELTIHRAGGLKAQLLAVLDAPNATVDLSGVTTIDTAGVQLLLMVRREAASRGSSLRLDAASEAVLEAFALLELSGHLGEAATRSGAADRAMPAPSEGFMDPDFAMRAFIAESVELIDAMEASLLAADEDIDEVEAEAIHAIFRAAHTIKGSAGIFGLDDVVAFTHAVEAVLDELRAGRLTISAPLVALLLSCCDHMRALIAKLASGKTDPDAGLQAQAHPLLRGLQTFLPARTVSSDATSRASHAVDRGPYLWHVSLRFGESVLRRGVDPISLLRSLAALGRIRRLLTLPESIPDAQTMDPVSCYLGFEIALETRADQASVESVFEFVRDDLALRILPLAGRGQDPVAALRPGPKNAAHFAAPTMSSSSTADHAARLAAPIRSEPARNVKARDVQSVRVDGDTLDRLIDLTGDLVLAAAGFASERVGVRAAAASAHELLATLVGEVRECALQLRMVKIGPSFQRFRRLVHDAARDLGKDIVLVIEGEDTQVDKTVLEKVVDPLTHLVRNAIDHGIGTPDVRRSRGKSARGTITLRAYHDADQLVIDVGDDGNGMDPASLRAKGIEMGLVEPGQALTEAETFDLIFEPGFSTAMSVTNLSGRGVGMDVVRRNITALNGSVTVASRHAVGTTVTVKLPVALTIVDGIQAVVQDVVFVVPRSAIEECVDFIGTGEPTELRGDVLPRIDLRRFFMLGGVPPTSRALVVLRHAGQRIGVVVDRILGQTQPVLRTACEVVTTIEGISGSSVSSNGDVLWILDVAALSRHAQRSSTASPCALPKRCLFRRAGPTEEPGERRAWPPEVESPL